MFKLKIGEAGESCALYIAKKLGFPKHMLDRAEIEAYKGKNINKNESLYTSNNSYDNIGNEYSKLKQNNTMKIKKDLPVKPTNQISTKFKIGDSVKIFPEKLMGIICKLANEKGDFCVQIKGNKILVNHKRIKLIASADEMYPVDYDSSIQIDLDSIK